MFRDGLCIRAESVSAAEVNNLRQKVSIMEKELSSNALKLNASENAKKSFEDKLKKQEEQVKKLESAKVRVVCCIWIRCLDECLDFMVLLLHEDRLWHTMVVKLRKSAPCTFSVLFSMHVINLFFLVCRWAVELQDEAEFINWKKQDVRLSFKLKV